MTIPTDHHLYPCKPPPLSLQTTISIPAAADHHLYPYIHLYRSSPLSPQTTISIPTDHHLYTHRPPPLSLQTTTCIPADYHLYPYRPPPLSLQTTTSIPTDHLNLYRPPPLSQYTSISIPMLVSDYALSQSFIVLQSDSSPVCKHAVPAIGWILQTCLPLS